MTDPRFTDPRYSDPRFEYPRLGDKRLDEKSARVGALIAGLFLVALIAFAVISHNHSIRIFGLHYFTLVHVGRVRAEWICRNGGGIGSSSSRSNF